MKRKINSSKLSTINYQLSIAPGFTLIEMLMVLIIITIVAASIMPVMGVIQRITGTQAGSRTIAIAVETARQLVNERVQKDKQDGGISLPWSGAAALFTSTGEIRFLVCDQTAKSNYLASHWGLSHSSYIADVKNSSDGSNSYHAYKDVKGRDYGHLPNGRGVVGIIRVNGDLHLITPPFAVRFNKAGVLTSGNPLKDTDSLIIYNDGDYGINQLGAGTRENPRYSSAGEYAMPSKDTLWAGEYYKLAFEQIESVIGVVLFDPSTPNQVNLDGVAPYGYLSQTAQERILKRGKVMFFNRYTGVPTRRLSHDK